MSRLAQPNEDYQAPTISQESTLESDVWVSLKAQSSSMTRADVKAWVSADIAYSDADAAAVAGALEAGATSYAKAKADLEAKGRADAETTARAAAWFTIVSELKARNSAKSTIDAAIVTGFGHTTEAAAANSEGLDAEVQQFWTALKASTTVDAAIQARQGLSAKMTQEAGAGATFFTDLRTTLKADLDAALQSSGGVDANLVADAFVKMHDSLATEATTLGLSSKASAALVLAAEADAATTLDLTVVAVVALTGTLDGIASGATTVELMALGNTDASAELLASVTAATDGSFRIEEPQEQPDDTTVVLIAKDLEGKVMAASDVDYQSSTMASDVEAAINAYTTATANATTAAEVDAAADAMTMAVIGDGTADNADDGALEAWLVSDLSGTLGATVLSSYDAAATATAAAQAAYSAGLTGAVSADNQVDAVTNAYAAFETSADITTALSGVAALDGGDASVITEVLLSVHATTAISGAFSGQ